MNDIWYEITGKDTKANPPDGLPTIPFPRTFLRAGAETMQLIKFDVRQARHLEHPRFCSVCGEVRDRRAMDFQVDAPRIKGLMTWGRSWTSQIPLCHVDLLAAFREDAVRRCLRLGRVFNRDGRELPEWRTVRARRSVQIRSRTLPEERTCNVCPGCGRLFFGAFWRSSRFFCAEPADLPIMQDFGGGSLIVSPDALKEPGEPKFPGCWTSRVARRTKPIDGFPAIMRPYADETPEIRSILQRELVWRMTPRPPCPEPVLERRRALPGTPEARIWLAAMHDWMLAAKVDPDDAFREAAAAEGTPPAVREEILRFLGAPWTERTLLGSCLPPGRAPRFLLDRIWRSLGHRFNEKDAPNAIAHLAAAGAAAAPAAAPAPVPGLPPPDAPCPEGPEARMLEDVLREREPFGRYTDMELWGWRLAGTALQVASLLALRAEPSAEARLAAVEAWARRAGRWLGDVPGTLAAAFGEPIAAGGRTRVHRNGSEVVKDVRLLPGEDPMDAFDRIVLHDYLFGASTPLRLLGFGRGPDGAFRLVLSQPWVPPAPAAGADDLRRFAAECLGFRAVRGAADERVTADVWWGATDARLIPSRTASVADDPALRDDTDKKKHDAAFHAFLGEVLTGGLSRPFSDRGTLVVLDADLRRNVPALGRGGRRGDAIPRLGLGADSIGVRFTETYLSRKYT